MKEIDHEQRDALTDDEQYAQAMHGLVFKSLGHQIRQSMPLLHPVRPGLVLSRYRKEFKQIRHIDCEIHEGHAGHNAIQRVKPRTFLRRQKDGKMLERKLK